MSLEKIAEGRGAELFRWGPGTVIKIYKSPDNDRQVGTEADATMRARALGAPVVRCDGVAEVEGRPGVVLEHLPGPAMGGLLLDGDIDRVAFEFGAMHAGLQSHSAAGETSHVELLRRAAKRATPEGLWQRVAAHFDQLPIDDRLVHADLHPYNVMWDGARWVAIDWDQVFCGHPAAGVARTLFLIVEAAYLEPVTTDDRRRAAADAYLAGYRSVAPMSDELIAQWRVPVIAARRAEGAVEEHDRLLEEIRAAV